MLIEITAHPQDKLVPVNSTVNLTCKSSVSYNVTFSWTRNGISISGSSTTGDTSILTITSVRDSDAGSYVCTVSSGSVSVMSNTATLTLKSKCDNNLIKITTETYALIYQEMLATFFKPGVRPAHTWFFKIVSVCECLYACVCVCMCVCPRGYY